MDKHQRLLANLTQDHANTCALVLTTHGLPYTVKNTDKGWEIWVAPSVYDDALAALAQYHRENPHRLTVVETVVEGEPEKWFKTYTGVGVALLLLAGHVAVGMTGDFSGIVRAGGASASRIMNGDIYRTVTALTLHADAAHLAGNMAGIVLFGTAVCHVTGIGVGWLMILLTGSLGNLANAAMFGHGHNAIGASTAVFGAVGILAAVQFVRKINTDGQRVRAWLPLAAGLALLGFLGSGQHTDLTAHLFGFMAGLGLGLTYGLWPYRYPERRVQTVAMAAAITILIVSWLRALNG